MTDTIRDLVRDYDRDCALRPMRETECTPALILLARGIRVSRHAQAIAKSLDLIRVPKGGEGAVTLDAISIRCLRMHRVILAAHGGDPITIEETLRAAGAYLGPFRSAMQVPREFLKRAEGTRMLLDIVNSGHSRTWRLPTTADIASRRVPRKPGFSQWRHALEATMSEGAA